MQGLKAIATQEYSIIRDAIQNLGAAIVEEHFHPEDFGSAYCVFRFAGEELFRLVRDGKEGYSYLQKAKPSGNWEDVGPRISDVTDLADLLSGVQGLNH